MDSTVTNLARHRPLGLGGRLYALLFTGPRRVVRGPPLKSDAMQPGKEAVEPVVLHVKQWQLSVARRLLLLVPVLVAAFCLRIMPANWPDQLQVMQQCDIWLVPLDRFITPLLLAFARALRLSPNEVLGEDLHDHVFTKRLKRVLLGVLVLNIVVSFSTFLHLLLSVLLLRAQG